jgi:D-beta-D-heptose 7-phosphate kinase/D-beta-D-heptose 1-phosphate adenosyltransferase
MSIISELIDKNRDNRIKVGVVGDCMIDQYHLVDVKRISPEAPIPVMLSRSEDASYILPGGAANVAYQFKKWNVNCTLFGLMSRVDAAVYERHGINLPKYYSGEWLEKRVPRKIRFQDQQSLIRWDIEDPNYGEEIDISNLIFCLEYYLEKEHLDVVILSDYDKGLFKSINKTKEIIRICKAYGVKTIVDPKNEPIEKWGGCNYFKPNSSEADKFSQGRGLTRISRRLPNSHIIKTSSNAVEVCTNENLEFEYVSEKNVAVSNYSGAGDCFAAIFALAVAHKFSVSECAELAYKAGQKYVQRCNNKPVSPLDLCDTKFVQPQDLRDRDFKLSCTNGCYDLGLHAGHISTFEFAKSKADKLVVLINSDDSIKRLKGENRPIIPLEQRMKILASLECIDYIIPFFDDTPYDAVKRISPDVLVKGSDWQGKKINSAELVKYVCFAPLVEGISTTKIIEKIIKTYKNL